MIPYTYVIIVLEFRSQSNQVMTILNKLEKFVHRNSLIVVLGIFVLAGLTYLLISHAATASISVEPETGSVTTPAKLHPDTSASQGNAVQFGPAPQPPTTGGMWIGAAQNEPNTTLASFIATSDSMGPLRVRRSFNSSAPNVPSSQPALIAGDAAAGISSFYSCKVNGGPAAINNGSQDANLRALFNSFPKNRMTYFTMWHEPENDINGGSFTSAQFAQMIAHIWDIKQSTSNAANIQVGYIAMDYWWRTGTTFQKNGDQILPPNGKFDFLAVDDYNTATTSGRTNAGTDPAFQNWYNWAKGKGKPLYVTEFGRKIDPNDPQARANDLLASETWLKSHGFGMFLYWNGSGAQGDWKLTDAPSQAAWKAIASRGRTQ
jgi:hypothetical protein